MTAMSIKTYSELIRIPTFEERFDYLKVGSKIGEDTFGFDRYLNQIFYRSPEWKELRRFVILRDDGCDLAFRDLPISGRVYIHHLNPISADDVKTRSEILLNPEFLVCTSFNTHQALHFGDKNLLPKEPIERSRNDTCPWKK